MKKIKILCSALAAAAFLTAATSCDLEIDESLGEAGSVYTETGCTLNSDGRYVCADVIAEGSNFVFAADQLTTSTGVSVSFNMKDDFEGAWTYKAFFTKQVYIFLAEMGYYPNGTWVGNFWVDDYASATNGGAYNSWQKNANFATVSFNIDGTITMYKNGVLLITYKSDGVSDDSASATITALWKAFISDLTTSGITTSITMKNLVITSAVTPAQAATLYNTYKN